MRQVDAAADDCGAGGGHFGHVSIGDRDVTDLAPRGRDIAMVFQNYALYPHMSVHKNLGYGLKVRKTPSSEIERRVADAARLLRLGVSSTVDRLRCPAASVSGWPWGAPSSASRPPS